MKWKRREQREILKRSDKIIDAADCRARHAIATNADASEACHLPGEAERWEQRLGDIKRGAVWYKRRGGAWENPDEKLSLVMLIVNDSVVRKIERLYYPLTRKAKPQTMLSTTGKNSEASPLRQMEVGHMTVMTPSSSRVCMIPIIMHDTKYLIFYI